MSTVRLFPVTVELRGDTGIPDATVIARINEILERDHERDRDGLRLSTPQLYVVRPFTASPPAEPPLAPPAPPPWTPKPSATKPSTTSTAAVRKRSRKPSRTTRTP